MKIDWIAVLQEQSENTKKMAEEVPKVLAAPGLTVLQASDLYRVVEQGAQNFERLQSSMEELDLDEPLLDIATSLSGIWDMLSLASANKLRTMQGLAPIGFLADEGGEERYQ